MDDGLGWHHVGYLLAVFLLLVCSAMISASEVAFFSLSQKELDEIRQDALRKNVQHLLSYPKKLLATILIANNLVNIAIVILSGFVISDLLSAVKWPEWLLFTIQVGVVTFFILLFGEIVPKIYATYQPQTIVRVMATPLGFMNVALSWVSAPLILSGNFLDRRLKKHELSLSANELNRVIEMTNDESVTEEEKKIWKGVVEFGTITVKETMKPRTDVMAVEYDTSFQELLEFILQAGYSRIPVYRETFDSIVGILYIKDVLPHIHEEGNYAWQPLIRPPFYVPENKMIDDLLKEFQEKKMHMAIVVDEFGGTSGIVTLEDIIEEIVGEINDEFDDEDVIYSRLDDSNYVFEGKTTLINLCRIIQIPYEQIEPFAGDADTLAGLILNVNERMPERGQVLTITNLRFTVESVDKRRIKRVKVTILKEPIEA
jgi:gliding motility-associated protein GldE